MNALRGALFRYAIAAAAWVVFILIMVIAAPVHPITSRVDITIAAITGLALGYSLNMVVRLLNRYPVLRRPGMDNQKFYTLEDGVAVPANWRTWMAWMEDKPRDRMLRRTEIEGPDQEALVSTVFLGIGILTDHRGRPLLYETLVRGSDLLDGEYRSASLNEAMECHEVLVVAVKGLMDGERVGRNGGDPRQRDVREPQQ